MNKNNESKSGIPEEESTLFSEPDVAETFTSKRKKSLLKRQRKLIVIFGIIAVLLTGSYLLFNMYVSHIGVLYEEDKSVVDDNPLAAWIVKNIIRPEDEGEQIELLDGEVRATGGNILMFTHTERSEIKSIDICNEYGSYGFYYDENYDDFYVKDHISAPYDKTLFSNLVVGTGYTIVSQRVAEDCEDFSEYGLADEDNPAYYVLTTRSGIRHTVYIGDETPSGNGYYARYKGRDAVYILGSDFSATVLAPIEKMISPTLTLPMTQNEYFTVKNFTVASEDKAELSITYLTDEERDEAGVNSSYKMLYPAEYNVNSTNYSTVLNTFISFTGSSTIVYAPDEEDLKEYGLLEPAHSVSYEYRGMNQSVVFSEKNENGNYYAYSLTFDLIAEVSGDTLAWLEWDMIKWVDSSIFMMNIDEVSAITVESPAVTRAFELVGEKDELVVTERLTGFKPDVYNFRQFYKTLLCIYIQGYATEDLSIEELDSLIGDEGNLGLTLTIELRSGEELVFKFYPYSTRRAYYTVDGSGEFYVLRDMMTKVIDDAEKVMTNTEIDAHAHS